MSLESALTSIGISVRASKVYVTCLQLGEATVSEIARTAAIKRPSTYLLIDELTIQGLLTTAKRGKRTCFSAVHPRRVLQIAQTRARHMEEILPQLEALYSDTKEKPRIKVFEGKNAVLQIYDEMYTSLGKREEALFFTSIGWLQKFFPESIERYKHRLKSTRRDYRIRELNIGDEEGISYLQNMQKIIGKKHEIRLLDPRAFSFETDNLIFGNTVSIFSFKKRIFTIVIEDKQIADSYRSLFNVAWQMGRSKP